MKKTIIFRLTSLAVAVVALCAAAFGEPLGGNRTAALANPMDSGFIANVGQWDPRALFYSNGPGVDVWVTKSGVKYDFFSQSRLDKDAFSGIKMKPTQRKGHVVEMKFLGAASGATGSGVDVQPTHINYITDRVSAQASVFNESRVLGLYGGVDLKLYKDGQSPRFDLLVAPRADASQIRFKYDGASNLKVGTDGSLLVGTRFGPVPFAKLTAFQNLSTGRAIVPCKFKIDGNGVVSFELGSYDRSKKLIIDPIVYSTFLGANGGDDFGVAVESDASGYAYVAGQTNSVSYPITNGAYDVTVNGIDVFVTKFTPNAAELVYSTVIGGSGVDSPRRIKLDHFGRLIIVGATESTNFPKTANAFDTTIGGANEGFIARLSPDGSNLNFSSYIGGSGLEVVQGLDTDADGNIYFGGITTSPDMPTTIGSFQSGFGGLIDSFAAKMLSNGTIQYWTYLGGPQNDQMGNLHVMPDGTACLAGTTQSRGFPTTLGAFDRVWQQGDGFITKIAPDGASLVFSTFLGGSSGEQISSLALDHAGNVFVIGRTSSVDFPRTPGVLDNVYSGGGENFLTKLSADGTVLLFSTFMVAGGNQTDIQVDTKGVSYILGSVSFPGAFLIQGDSDDPDFNGPNDILRAGDAYLQVVNEAGNGVLYGSYLGGDQEEQGLGMFLDTKGNVYVTGWTNSYVDLPEHPGFPTTPGVFKPRMINDNFPLDDISNTDAWLMKIKIRNLSLIQNFGIGPNNVAGTNRTRGNITLTKAAPAAGYFLSIESSDSSIARAIDGVGLPISQIFIPEGATGGGFAIETFDVSVPRAVRFAITLNDDVRTADMVVRPMLSNFQVSPISIVGGGAGSGVLNLSQPAPAGGVTVHISVNRPEIARPTAGGTDGTDVFVPAGVAQMPFTFTTSGVDVNPSSQDGGTSVNFIAKVVTPPLTFTIKRTIRVLPAKLIAVTVDPGTIFEGEQTQARLTLDGEAGPSGLEALARIVPVGGAQIVLLDVGSGGEVTVPAGATEGFFRIKAKSASKDGYRVIGVSGGRQPGELFAKVNVLAATIDELILDKSVVEGGQVVNARVRISRPVVGQPLPINLRLNPPKGTSKFAALESDTVEIPVGGTLSSPVRINTLRTLEDRTITVEASKAGLGTLTKSFIIKGLSFGFTIAPTSVIGGNTSTGTIKLGRPAEAGGVDISISSSVPGVAYVPVTVNVPEGSDTASFPIGTATVGLTTTVDIKATLNAVPTPLVITRQLTIKPVEPNLSRFEIVPDSVVGGDSALATIRFDRPSPGNRTIKLAAVADLPGGPYITVPPTVTMSSGASVVTFKVKTSLPPQSTVGTVTASFNGKDLEDTLTILAPALVDFTITPSTVAGGKTAVGIVTLDSPAPDSGLTIELFVSPDSTGAPFTSMPSTVTIPAGATSASFNIKTSVPSRTVATAVTASYSSGAITTVLTITRS